MVAENRCVEVVSEVIWSKRSSWWRWCSMTSSAQSSSVYTSSSVLPTAPSYTSIIMRCPHVDGQCPVVTPLETEVG